jgi:hypothetical protein
MIIPKDTRASKDTASEDLISRLERMDKELHVKRVMSLARMLGGHISVSPERNRKENIRMLMRALSDDSVCEAFRRANNAAMAPIFIKPLKLDCRLYAEGGPDRVFSYLKANYEDFDSRVNELAENGISIKMCSLIEEQLGGVPDVGGKASKKHLFRIYGHKFLLSRTPKFFLDSDPCTGGKPA